MAAQKKGGAHLVSCIKEGNCSKEDVKSQKEAMIKWISSSNTIPDKPGDIRTWFNKRGYYIIVMAGTPAFSWKLPEGKTDIKTQWKNWHWSQWKIGEKKWSFLMIKKI